MIRRGKEVGMENVVAAQNQARLESELRRATRSDLEHVRRQARGAARVAPDPRAWVPTLDLIDRECRRRGIS